MADGLATALKISSNRAPEYKPSSKPYQRRPCAGFLPSIKSLKKICPLISPAKSALVSLILALTKECPVFHISGLPCLALIQGARLRVDFTS